MTYDPPCLLYMTGNGYREGSAAIAIVGTRHPSQYGTTMAETLGRDLAYSGVNVVSGMARGCDMSAHKGALKARRVTTAVLGTGWMKSTPGKPKPTPEIVEKGVVISEYPMGMPPQPYNFPKRNRIISGLYGSSRGRSAAPGGSLMTARLASSTAGRSRLPRPGQLAQEQRHQQAHKDGAALIEGAGTSSRPSLTSGPEREVEFHNAGRRREAPFDRRSAREPRT
jgi:DNA processing protein